MTNEESKNKQILLMARYIQQGERARERGEFDCSEFSVDERCEVGVQRLAGAIYLYDLGYRMVIPDDITIIVKDGRVMNVYSTNENIAANVIDLDVQDPDELAELEKSANKACEEQISIW